MDFIKGNEQIKIDPSGIDISGAGHIIIDSEKIIGDICLNGDLSMNGNLEVYGGKIGIGKTPAYNYNLDVEGSINCTGQVLVNGNSLTAGSGDPIVANGMIVQIRHTDYNKKVVKVDAGWSWIDRRTDGNGFVVKITPTSPNSKILIDAIAHVGISPANDTRWWGIRLYRKIGDGDWDLVTGAQGDVSVAHSIQNSDQTQVTAGHVHQGQGVWFSHNVGMIDNTNLHDDDHLISNSSGSYLDSPGTTQEVMYTLYWNGRIGETNNSSSIYLNRSHVHNDYYRPTPSSSIRATEIWDEPGAYIPTNSAIMVDGTNDNVGIGTSTPATGVDIHRDLSLNGNIEISNNDTFVITNEGYVGIGTSEPDFPLTIGSGRLLYFNANGYVGTNYEHDNNKFAFTNYWQGNWNSGVIVSNGSSQNTVVSTISLRAKRSIWTETYLLSSSDKRIKTDISLVVDDTALNRVNALESKEYNYIDPERRQPMKTIGFIAQEVKEVVPSAVSLEKNYIPDEMRLITEPVWREDASKVYLDIPDLDMSGAFTGKAKFYVSNDPSGNDEVCKEVEIKEVPASAMNEFSTTPYVAEFDQSWNNVFFYGKEVSDFHTIDKAQIFALHHSAIQELDRKHKREVEEKNNKIENLEQNISGLNSQVSSLTSRLEALEASVLALQNN